MAVLVLLYCPDGARDLFDGWPGAVVGPSHGRRAPVVGRRSSAAAGPEALAAGARPTSRRR